MDCHSYNHHVTLRNHLDTPQIDLHIHFDLYSPSHHYRLHIDHILALGDFSLSSESYFSTPSSDSRRPVIPSVSISVSVPVPTPIKSRFQSLSFRLKLVPGSNWSESRTCPRLELVLDSNWSQTRIGSTVELLPLRLKAWAGPNLTPEPNPNPKPATYLNNLFFNAR